MIQIKLLGTSHIAKQSVAEIKKAILEDKPEIIGIELDANRYHSLFEKKRKIRLRDAKSLGVFGFLFAIVGAFIQRKLGEKIGMAPGADMKTAIVHGRKAGAKIFLIDRNIQTTIQRMSTLMPRSEKLKLVGYVLFGGFLPSARKLRKKIDLKKVPSKELIVEMIKEISKRFPILYQILITERNEFMAHRIKQIHKKFPKDNILVIVGAGHISGLRELLRK